MTDTTLQLKKTIEALEVRVGALLCERSDALFAVILERDALQKEVATLKTMLNEKRVITSEAIYLAARELNKTVSLGCGVDIEDAWKVYGDGYLIDARNILNATLKESA